MQIHMQYIAMHLNVLSTIAEGNKQQTIKQSIQSKNVQRIMIYLDLLHKM